MNEVLTAADVASSSRTSMAPPSSTSSLASNLPLVSAFFAFSLAQFLKLFTTWSPSKFSRPITAVTWKNLASNACTRMRFFEALLWECLVPNRFKEKRWDSRRLLGSGGMPSSHSATVVALAVAIGLQEGAGSSSFALAVILASIVMYDASGIRLHAGRQAELLNQIVCELPPEHPLSSVRPLREPLGHTPLQVCAGAVLGCFVSYLMRYSG